MPFTVVLEGEQREEIEKVVDSTGSLSRLLLKFRVRQPLLETIDPYGDTVFNRLQAAQLVGEWSAVEAQARTDHDQRMCLQVRHLFERAANGVHLYVRFEGD